MRKKQENMPILKRKDLVSRNRTARASDVGLKGKDYN